MITGFILLSNVHHLVTINVINEMKTNIAVLAASAIHTDGEVFTYMFTC